MSATATHAGEWPGRLREHTAFVVDAILRAYAQILFSRSRITSGRLRLAPSAALRPPW